MAIFNPTFGCMSLQQATKIGTIIKIILQLLALIGIGLAVAVHGFLTAILTDGVCNDRCSQQGIESLTTFYVILVVYGLIILLIIAMLVLDILLILAARHRNLSRCNLWFVFNCICSIISFLLGCVTFCFSELYFLRVWAVGLGTCILFGYSVYMMLIVNAFREELKKEDATITPPNSQLQSQQQEESIIPANNITLP